MNRPSLCWRCKKLIGLDEQCPYCGAKNSGATRWLSSAFGSVSGLQTAQMLLYFCAGIFALSLLVGLLLHGAGGLQSIMRPSSSLLNVMGVNIFARDPSRWWTMVTGVFLHIGILHLAFNLYGLHVLGRYLSHTFSSSWMWVVFMISALVGAFLTASLGNVSAGASGGLFGWLGASVYVAFRSGGMQDPVFRSLLVWGGISLLLGFSMGGRIDNTSHVAGLISGLFLASVWSAFGPRRGFGKTVQLVGVGLVALVVLSYALQARIIFLVFR